VNAENPSPQRDSYLCPGEQHPISRAVHLGRLAAFYPACRQCPRRDDTGSISPRRVVQLAETSHRGRPRSLFHDEGAGGVYLNDLTPAAAKCIAAAFGNVMRESEAFRPSPSAFPLFSVLLAGDGRPLSAELLAAAAEGLRSSGCDVVDLGPSTAPCLAFAMRHLESLGGVLIGNPGEDSHTVGMKFWTAGPRPLSAGGSLEPIIARYDAGDCPNFRVSENGTVPVVATRAGIGQSSRNYGRLSRYRADGPYIAEMSKFYHALRPLRVVVDSASGPTMDSLRRLAAAVACEVIPSRSTRNDLPRQIRDDAAHFAVCIDGDGESCRALDEQGRTIPPERLFLLLARQSSTATVALETETPQAIADRLGQLGMHVVRSSPRRADMAAAMQEHGAMLGGGPSGRFWHAALGLPLCDALMTVTRLLQTLSRSDAPLSRVLDREAPLE
jgi:phosphomannomutase